MKAIIKILAGLILILAGLFLYLPPVGTIPCLGWYKDLLILIKGSAGGIAILIGLVFFAIVKE
ncbi:MAG: hypothetical protein JW827_10810 [Spirochaetes bacterium]|nr:hypothetical protein [Spirochaetota bacterium]